MINWTEVTGLCAAFGAMSTILLFVMRAVVRDEIRKLNGTYLRRELAEEKFAQIETHFDYLRDIIEPLRESNSKR